MAPSPLHGVKVIPDDRSGEGGANTPTTPPPPPTTTPTTNDGSLVKESQGKNSKKQSSFNNTTSSTSPLGGKSAAVPTASSEAAKVFGGTRALDDDDVDDEEEEEDSWRDAAMRHRYAFVGVVLVAVSAWLAAVDSGHEHRWKHTAMAAGFFLGKPIAQGMVYVVVFVLQNVLPLDQVAYYFHVLSPPLTQLIRFIGLAVMWSLFYSESYVGVRAHQSTVKIFVIFGLFLASRCVALLMVKILTARLHAGTFWDQLRSTVRHELLLKSLTGPPIRPRPGKDKHRMRSGSKTGAFITSATEKLRGHARTPSNQSDTSDPAAMQEMHATIGASMSETEHATWEGETGDVRLAAEKAEALMKAGTSSSSGSIFSSAKIFNSMFKSSHHSHMTKFGNTERLLDKANSGSANEDELKRATRLIFNHIRRPGNKFITKEAVEDFIPSKDVVEAFNLLAGVDSFEFSALGFNDLSRGLRTMFEERKLLGQTLSSMQGLAETLGRSLQVLFFFIVAIIGLFMFQVDVSSLWLLFSSSVLALTFIFGSSASRAFEAAVMIFAVHPFNIGDWIMYQENNYKVMELGINCTKLLALGGEIVYIPTSQLATVQITNLTRSNPLWMKISLMIDIGMTQAQAKVIENTVRQFMETDKRNYGRDVMVLLRGTAVELLKVEFNVLYTLTFNGSQRGAMLEAHSRMLFVVTNALIAMGVSYTGTDGMIFASNMDTLGPPLTATSTSGAPPQSTTLYGRGFSTDSSPNTSQPSLTNLNSEPHAALARNTENFAPHTSFFRSNATQQRFALQGNLRHLSGMLKMD